MSGLARILLEEGKRVSGSDAEDSPVVKRLKSIGARISIGHKASNITNQDIVVYSSSIRKENAEMVEADLKGIPLISRGKMLSLLLNPRKGIAVCGSHGKSTVSSLVALIVKRAGLGPTFAIGADINELEGNAGSGTGDIFVAEADESDGSFLYLEPYYAILTNMDKEHMDYYADMKEVKNAYIKFMRHIKPAGKLLYCLDDKPLAKAVASFDGAKLSYGIDSGADMLAYDISLKGSSSYFRCRYKGDEIGEMEISLAGRHNVCNALAAIGLSMEMGIGFDTAKKDLGGFKGMKRRMGILYDSFGIRVMDDYAHHPTEIRATLEAIRNMCEGRLICVFQPHRYTRTKSLAAEFGASFGDSDALILTDIYSAGEPAIEGVSAMDIVKSTAAAGYRDVRYVPKNEIPAYLTDIIKKGDTVAFLGAGDIGKVAQDFKAVLVKTEKVIRSK